MLIGKWEKYHAIDARSVARAMIQSAKDNKPGFAVYEYEEILQLSKKLDTPIAHQHPE